MPLHPRFVPQEEDLLLNSSIDGQYRRARPFLKLVTDLLGEGKYNLDIHKTLKEGNPNVERLMFYQAGYEAAMKTFLELIDPN